MGCKNLCERIGFSKKDMSKLNNTLKNSNYYTLGYKYCARCEMWFLMQDVRCPCCKNKVRCNTRSSTLKRIYETKGIIKRIE